MPAARPVPWHSVPLCVISLVSSPFFFGCGWSARKVESRHRSMQLGINYTSMLAAFSTLSSCQNRRDLSAPKTITIFNVRRLFTVISASTCLLRVAVSNLSDFFIRTSIRKPRQKRWDGRILSSIENNTMWIMDLSGFFTGYASVSEYPKICATNH
ncbi:uncharacterized protein BT62DRAFT_212071 [Guyanagaster necrorhizus]|uniref:Uncharacterized protein n=1 Tax=Guyanagaster necrorhizus TaxID=856835 RepID=A0A9P8ARF6_9AGAR|nr:uncharacterized protein BT62DRAFT_212071 [Guyanagaster necrorhizus MCA 3950]KAG7445144.1 hypothetical protein BT62DRAFT_212071 [Guyanagaster necrorhizus MCA 3950]